MVVGAFCDAFSDLMGVACVWLGARRLHPLIRVTGQLVSWRGIGYEKLGGDWAGVRLALDSFLFGVNECDCSFCTKYTYLVRSS